MNASQHWNNVYSTKAENEVSWFQHYPETSMQLIESLNLPEDAAIIDIGGGDSRLAEALLDKGYTNIYVVDIAARAIERAKQRMGEKATSINWIVADITKFEPLIQFDLWHDRAAFHFLTAPDAIEQYSAIAEKAVKKDRYLIMATFSDKGPTKCSRLDIKQYTAATMEAVFEPAFYTTRCITQDHTTPSGAIQHFLFCIIKRK